MKVFQIFILLFILTEPSLAQEKIGKLFEAAEKSIKVENLDSALFYYEFITENFKDNQSYSRALFNKAYVLRMLGENEKSKDLFKQILKSKFNDNEKGPGSGIVSEPYAIYKHRAARNLAELHLEESSYKIALKYTKMADKKYQYEHFCGNEFAANDIIFAVLYSRCYNGIGDNNKAINLLWDYIFNYGLANNQIAIEQMALLLKEVYSESEIKKELKNAVSTINIESKFNETKATIEIFNQKIILPNDITLWIHKYEKFLELEYRSLEYYKEIYIGSLFYTTLMN
tara:strand:+ start:555 stop:1412 length:858 start_codon:yes stop_codon:yes gene_type:complete